MFNSELGRTMEDMFFFEREQTLIEARKKLEQLKETKENLAKVSGIRNEAVLENLVALGIRPETLTTLLAVPLAEVAWADGELQEKERDALIAYAEKAGVRNKDVNPETVSAWLRRKPEVELMNAWELYIQALSRELSESDRLALKEEVMADARSIADAAGGFLGFGRLCQAEQRMLARLEAAFG